LSTETPSLAPAAVVPEALALHDGTTVVRRPIAPDDRDRLVAFHARLSPESVYRRYLAPKAKLSPADLTYLTEVDHHHHEALVLALPAAAGGELLGVGRFVEQPDTGTAEVAFLVADAWQGLGAGSLLLDGLASRARGAGLQRLEAWVMLDNRPMLEVFAHSGLPRHERLREGLVHVTLELARDEAAGHTAPSATSG
jgi:GNAT superfamily N-acetyltransferase